MAPSDFPPEAPQAAAYALGSVTTFVSSVASAVIAGLVLWWLGVGQEKRAQLQRFTLIVDRKYQVILIAVRRAVESPGECETPAYELVSIVRRELGMVLDYGKDMPLKALEDALAGTKPKEKEVAKPEDKLVTPVPKTICLEEAKVLTTGLFGGEIGDGYIVKDPLPVPPKVDKPPSETEVLEARRFRIWQALGKFQQYWNDETARKSELKAIQTALAREVPPKPADPNCSPRIWDRRGQFQWQGKPPSLG